MHVPRIRLCLAALALAALAPPARADLISTNMDAGTPIFTFSVPSQGVYGESGYVGPNTVAYGSNDPIAGYCTDLFRTITDHDSYEVTPQSLSQLANGDLVAKILGADLARHDNSYLEKAAVQLAVWNVVETGRAGLGQWTDPLAFNGPNVDRGLNHIYVYADVARTQLLFGLSSDDLVLDDAGGQGVLQRMDAIIAEALELPAAPAGIVYYQPSTSYGQGFVGIRPGSIGLRSIPEPSSLATIGLGSTVLIGTWARRKMLKR